MIWVWRILGVLALLIVCAVLTLFILSRREGANVMVTDVEVNKPPAEVWLWVTEPELQKKWVSWLVDIKDIKRVDGGIGSRATWVMEDRNNNNQKMEIHSEVIEYEVNKLVKVKLDSNESFSGNASYTLTDLGNGRTRVTSRGEYHMSSAVFRLLLPVIMPQAKKKMTTDFASMKAQAEAAPAQAAVAK